MIHIEDVTKDDEYTLGDKYNFDVRTLLGVPLMREDVAVGVIILQRATAQPFTDKQIELATTFADQAVIAIENVRLFDEVKKRTEELSEALEQQTATSEVLRVISGSPGDLQPVFQAMLENAARICGARFGVLLRTENGEVETGATYNVPAAIERYLAGRGRAKVRPTSTTQRAMQTRDVVQVLDVRDDVDARDNPAAKYGGARTLLTVPMLKDDEVIGVFNIYRQEVRPFTDKQIELVQNFAAQAVIAIENTRLLNELRQRTDDLSESLEQQTATSEVLSVISGSPGDLEPVFRAMLESATRICEAKFGNFLLSEDDGFRVKMVHGEIADWTKFRQHEPLVRPGPKDPLRRVIESKQPIHIKDLRTELAYLDREPSIIPIVEVAGARTILVVPMLKEGRLVGAIGIYRQEIRPFTDKQIALMQNFAAQAVIAIENARLLNELRQRTDDLSEALEQQTATSEVLKVIS